MNTDVAAVRQPSQGSNPLPFPINLNAIELPPRDWQENRDTRQRMRDWRRKSEAATSVSSSSAASTSSSSSSSSRLPSAAAAGKPQTNNRAKHTLMNTQAAPTISNTLAPIPPPPVARANVGTSESIRVDSTGRKLISLKRSFESTSISAPSSIPQATASSTAASFTVSSSRASASPSSSTASPSAMMTDVTPPAVPSLISGNTTSEEPPKRRKLDRNFHSSDAVVVGLQFG